MLYMKCKEFYIKIIDETCNIAHATLYHVHKITYSLQENNYLYLVGKITIYVVNFSVLVRYFSILSILIIFLLRHSCGINVAFRCTLTYQHSH